MKFLSYSVLLTFFCCVLCLNAEDAEEQNREGKQLRKHIEHEGWRVMESRNWEDSGEWIPKDTAPLEENPAPRRRRIRKRKRRPPHSSLEEAEGYPLRRRRIRPQTLEDVSDHWSNIEEESPRRPYSRRRTTPVYLPEESVELIEPLSAVLRFGEDKTERPKPFWGYEKKAPSSQEDNTEREKSPQDYVKKPSSTLFELEEDNTERPKPPWGSLKKPSLAQVQLEEDHTETSKSPHGYVKKPSSTLFESEEDNIKRSKPSGGYARNPPLVQFQLEEDHTVIPKSPQGYVQKKPSSALFELTEDNTKSPHFEEDSTETPEPPRVYEKVRDPFTALEEAEAKARLKKKQQEVEPETTTVSHLKALLKQSGGSLNLSELLQQKNLSLEDLLNGKEKAISALTEKSESVTVFYAEKQENPHTFNKTTNRNYEASEDSSEVNTPKLTTQRARLGLFPTKRYEVVTEPTTERRIFVPSHSKLYLNYKPSMKPFSTAKPQTTRATPISSTRKHSLGNKYLDYRSKYASLRPKLKTLPMTSAKLNRLVSKHPVVETTTPFIQTTSTPIIRITTPLPPKAFKIDIKDLLGLGETTKQDGPIKMTFDIGKLMEKAEKPTTTHKSKETLMETVENPTTTLNDIGKLMAKVDNPTTTLNDIEKLMETVEKSTTTLNDIGKLMEKVEKPTMTFNGIEKLMETVENPTTTLMAKVEKPTTTLNPETDVKMLDNAENEMTSTEFNNEKIQPTSARDEIMEILKDHVSRQNLSRILELRNMTIEELVAQRERGSSQLHLADIFHNQTREPEPPNEPYVGHINAFFDRNLTLVQRKLPYLQNQTSSFERKPKAIGELKKDSERSNYFKSVDLKPLRLNSEDKEGGAESNPAVPVYTVTSFPTYKIEMEKIIKSNQAPPFQISLWKNLYPNLYPGGVESNQEEELDVLKPSKVEDILQNEIRRVEDVENTISEAVNGQLNIELNENNYEDVADYFPLPRGVKSTIIASAAIIGISVFVFLTVFIIFKWLQKQRKRLSYSSSFSCSRIKSPILEPRPRRTLRAFMSETLGRKKKYSNVYPQSMSDYIWESDKKPFQ